MVGESHKTTRMVDDAELQIIADDVALVPDSDANAPDHADYTTTYDLYRAAAEAWDRKANMVAEGFDFIAEGGEFSRSQVFKHYISQARRYRGMASSLSVAVGRPAVEDADANAFDNYLEGLS